MLDLDFPGSRNLQGWCCSFDCSSWRSFGSALSTGLWTKICLWGVARYIVNFGYFGHSYFASFVEDERWCSYWRTCCFASLVFSPCFWCGRHCSSVTMWEWSRGRHLWSSNAELVKENGSTFEHSILSWVHSDSLQHNSKCLRTRMLISFVR